VNNQAWSFPETAWNVDPQPQVDPEWNEVLTEANEGFGTFVEWTGGTHGLWMRDWIWSSDPWATAGDFAPVSEVTWWLPETRETCLAACPKWVEGAPGRCLPAEVPSVHGDRVLTLRTSVGETSLDLSALVPSPWATDHAGLSHIKLVGADVWTSSPAHIRASPGRPNNASFGTAGVVHGDLVCSPKTLQPGGARASDVVQITWRPPATDDVFEAEYGIVNPRGRSPMNGNQTLWAGEPLHWTWHGQDEAGVIQPPGTYVALVAWRNLSKGGRGVDRCLVALAPH
jgi:hypothetical protein